MSVNMDRPEYVWKADVAESVSMYNEWFLRFAPTAFAQTRDDVEDLVERCLSATSYLTNISPDVLSSDPGIISTLRMSTCPPLAVDRLIGLAGVKASLVKTMEEGHRLPARMSRADLFDELTKIGAVIQQMADYEVFPWLKMRRGPTDSEIHRASTIIADRLCTAQANPIIRNEQEKRQLGKIKDWLDARGYRQIPVHQRVDFRDMQPGTYSFRLNVVVGENNPVNIPVDAVIMPRRARPGSFPLLIEAKSAGDFTNTNKRRKEEAAKVNQLHDTYGDDINFVLFLCGYFGIGYLRYEAEEGIDWVWEHRIDDLAEFGL
ncbi:XamI family restriction endonuclease [Stenotrophomonas rhizophila]|nr:XamI family restriction endonuclease [Stenotrophomonas rhizophila]